MLKNVGFLGLGTVGKHMAVNLTKGNYKLTVYDTDPAPVAELVERGVPLTQALAPFTANPATLLRLTGKGAIRVGGDADLVALNATGGADTVIIRGLVHVAGGVAVRRGTFER